MTLASAGSAGAQTCPYPGYVGYAQYAGVPGCEAPTTASVLAGSSTTSGPTLALTGETAAIPLAAAAGLMIIVLGARQLRRRTDS